MSTDRATTDGVLVRRAWHLSPVGFSVRGCLPNTVGARYPRWPNRQQSQQGKSTPGSGACDLFCPQNPLSIRFHPAHGCNWLKTLLGNRANLRRSAGIVTQSFAPCNWRLVTASSPRKAPRHSSRSSPSLVTTPPCLWARWPGTSIACGSSRTVASPRVRRARAGSTRESATRNR